MNRALVHHGLETLELVLSEKIPAGHEVLVTNLECRSEQSSDIDLGASAKKNAIRV